MKVSKIRFKNVLGMDEFSMEPGSVTVLSGRNGTGKSSALRGLQNLMEGGSLSEIRNVDADPEEKAEIALTFEDDELGQVLAHKNENRLDVRKQVEDSAAFEKQPKPAEFLRSLFDGKLNNPMQFLTCRDKDRVQFILEAIDLEYDAGELWQKLGLDQEDFEPVPAGLHPLIEIRMHRDHIFKTRTGVNRDEKQKRAHCDQTRRSVPAEIPTVEGLAEKEAELSELKEEKILLSESANRTHQTAMRTIDAVHDEFKREKQAELDNYRLELTAELERKLNAKREEIGDEISNHHAASEDAAVKADTEREQAFAKVNELTDEIIELQDVVSTMREQEKDEVRIRTLHEQADKAEQEADDLEQLSKRLSDALEILDNYKAAMCSDLPVPGLDITDNIITVNGVKWDQLNTAQRIQIATKISCLRLQNSRFKIVFVDGAEALDSNSFGVMVEELKDADAQAFIGRVADHDFKIEKVN